ncbi:MAG: Gfo/Idh/MocA family oxidoreductase [Clostridia bacterium]|nr:Gfo/Idh/MocA family oxidoreductase [Clostridia bacterium]
MKKIGFVDYFISEWHANNYPAWIDRIAAEMGVDYKVAYAWAELETSPIDGLTTAEWCEKFGAESCATIDELCEKSDVIVILSPSNPETHLRYAEAVLKHGKRTYIDKTFAPDSAVAKEIFALGEKYGTPFFSTSALRYATELDAVDAPDSLLVTGGGSNLPEYFIHLGEMVVKKMGAVKCVKATANGSQWIIQAKTTSGKDATMIWGASMPYGAYMTKSGKETWKSLKSPFFDGLIADMLNFFETGKASFDCAETLEVMALRDAALAAVETPGEEIEV